MNKPEEAEPEMTLDDQVNEIIDALVADVHFEKTWPSHTAYYQIDLNQFQGKLRQALSSHEEKVRADWLRSEIEKLEWKLTEATERPMRHFNGNENHDYNEGYSNALTSIITRYKEELKVMENK